MVVWPYPPVFWSPGWRHALADIVDERQDSSRKARTMTQRTVSASASMPPWANASQRLLRLARDILLLFGVAVQ